MRFDRYLPTAQLKPYIKYFVVSENESAKEYKVFPSAGLVIGFQYEGRLSTISAGGECHLAPAGITGMTDTYKIFRSSAGIGTILVYFTEIGFTHFAIHPANELYNLSISLDDIFSRQSIAQVQQKLASAQTDTLRVKAVEEFLISHLRETASDRLIESAVKMIYESKGTIRIKELNKIFHISQSPFEKRFRKIVGATPKKFASIVRFNAVIDSFARAKSLTEIGYENNFFDQAHFIKDFKQFTGDTPEQFKRHL